MSNVLKKPKLSDKQKGRVVGVLLVILAAANLVPLHYSNQGNCPGGGTYEQSGVTLGLPVAFYRTTHGGFRECPGLVGDSPKSGFSVQALLTDALVFGVVTTGINLLLDRRTKA